KNRNIDFAEISFYFQLPIMTPNGVTQDETFALVSTYCPPHEGILQKSHDPLWSCTHGRIDDMEIIPLKTILAVVAMILHKLFQSDPEQRYFLAEKSGLDVACMGGVQEDIPDE
ncbi:hypothetical protein L208DRAFT_1292744, partial [Tricholoma matsutake]